MKTITLSYSTLNTLINSSHQWVCKMAGVQVPDNKYLTQGRDGEKIIQRHIAGTKYSESLRGLKITADIIPIVDMDKSVMFERYFKYKNEEYRVIGFADALNTKDKAIIEVKLSGSPWSIKKYRESLQRKMYVWGFGKQFKKSILITSFREPNLWNDRTVYIREVKHRKNDNKEVEAWMAKGIEILKSGKYTGGLDENGKCNDRWCLYGENCLYK